MKNLIYNPTRIRSLKQLQYEKARVTIEMAYIEESVQKNVHNFLHGGFMDAMGMGLGAFASFAKWKIYFKAISKGWKWVREILHKRKEHQNNPEAAK